MTRDADPNTDVGQNSWVSVSSADVPVFCPNPTMPLWSSHPRVFLELPDGGEAMCPYCGTRYRLTNDGRRVENELGNKAED
ncbi:MAG: zinc-finger domain-containing protein [Casimicrobiaceae bacterium]